MGKAKHTPTPWGYDGDGFDSVAAQHCNTDGYTIFPLDEDGDACGHICEMSEAEGDEEAEANAAFICKAVNNHESLLEALKSLLHEHRHYNDSPAATQARAAIAAVTGEA